jgi:FAD-linked oxidoreductase
MHKDIFVKDRYLMAMTSLQRWQNWSGSVQASPAQVIRPRTTEALVAQVTRYAREGRQMRVVGAGHSFTPLVQTDDILFSLDELQGIEHVDAEQSLVTVAAGTRLRQLGQLLFEQGFEQENLGDIDVQSIAGAISTGTHGTGLKFGTIATQVERLTLVTAQGELLTCSATENPDIFKAAQVSFGTLGIITSVTLRVVPAVRLHLRSRRERLSTTLTEVTQRVKEHSHYEFFWFPYTDLGQAKYMDETEEPVSGNKVWANFNRTVIENGALWLLSEISRLVPKSAPTISKICANSIANVDEVEYSHRLYATQRDVRFQEMEYNLPTEEFVPVMQEIQECINKHKFAVHFPIECRFVRGDDIWLSPAYQRDSAYVAVHMYRGMEYKPYFRHIEEIFKNHQGRPHWGKMHTRTAEDFAQLYPRWYDFQRVRAQLDPAGVFLNSYLRSVLGVNTDVTV